MLLHNAVVSSSAWGVVVRGGACVCWRRLKCTICTRVHVLVKHRLYRFVEAACRAVCGVLLLSKSRSTAPVFQLERCRACSCCSKMHAVQCLACRHCDQETIETNVALSPPLR